MSGRILVVDDEEKIRLIIRKYGEFEGYEIDEAANGMEAVEKCQKQDYDLLIMDVMMPELDGFSTCAAIKKTKDIPVIMLSARGEEYDRIHGFECGVDDYVVKPFSPKELMMRAKVVMSRQKTTEEKMDIYTYEGLEVCQRHADTGRCDGIYAQSAVGAFDRTLDRDFPFAGMAGIQSHIQVSDPSELIGKGYGRG